MLAPTTLFVTTITMINAVKVFETVTTLTQGGPSKASEVLLWTIYEEGFIYLHLGNASAMAVVFVAVLLVLIVLQDARARQEGPLRMSASAPPLDHDIAAARPALRRGRHRAVRRPVGNRAHHPPRRADNRRGDPVAALYLDDLDVAEATIRGILLWIVADPAALGDHRELYQGADPRADATDPLQRRLRLCRDLGVPDHLRAAGGLCTGAAEVPRPGIAVRLRHPWPARADPTRSRSRSTPRRAG